MSTPSLVAVKSENKIKGIYVHYDGNSEYMKENLKEYFNTYEKAMQLIELGDMSGITGDLEACKKEAYYYKAYNAFGYSHMINEIVRDKNCFKAREFDSVTAAHNYAVDNDLQFYLYDGDWKKEDFEYNYLEII